MKPLHTLTFLSLGLLCALCAPFASAQKSAKAPHLGYAYPAGAERGSTIEITVGGRYLAGAKSAIVTGKGVQVEVLDHFGVFQRRYKTYLRDVSKKARELERDETFQNAPPEEQAKLFQAMVKSVESVTQGNREFKVPDHPYFNRIAELSPDEFQEVTRKFMMMEGVQTNNEISELLTLRIQIGQDAPMGTREIRLRSFNGYSNPLFFQVGGMPEALEIEPNDESVKGEPLKTPITQNGQIMPGDVDCIRFSATQGQKLVLNLHARQLLPYLADAVPGWFQAVLSLHDATGKEIAYADDYLFHPDPVILFEVPQDGIYEARVRDSIYRGREDFVYRLSIAESPFVTSYYPLGGEAGVPQLAELEGWNLPSKKVRLKSAGTSPLSTSRFLKNEIALSNPIHHETTAGPNILENEGNNESIEHAQSVDYPCTISGRIDRPGDKDIYRLSAKAGQALFAEVRARRLYSPVDSTLQLFDAKGRQLAWNDDLPNPSNIGFLTHHADSELEATFPTDGEYFLQITDTQNQGGPAYGYRLQIGDPQPGFKVWAYPPTIQVGAGQSVVMTAKVQRLGRFHGPVTLQLSEDAEGFSISGATIPSGKDQIEFTLTAPERARSPLARIKLQALGEGEIADISESVVPCEERIQAFITPHYLEKPSFIVETLRRPRTNISYVSAQSEPVTLSQGSQVELSFKKKDATPFSNSRITIESIEYDLRTDIQGLTLVESHDLANSVKLTLSLESDASSSPEGNIVIDAYAKVRNANAKNNKLQSIYIGALPAVPYQISL